MKRQPKLKAWAVCGRYEFEEIEESALFPVGNISICKACAQVEIARQA